MVWIQPLLSRSSNNACQWVAELQLRAVFGKGSSGWPSGWPGGPMAGTVVYRLLNWFCNDSG